MSDRGTARRRVVVTGIGLKCPSGNDVDSAWRKLLSGASSIGPIVRFDASYLPVRFAGEVRGFDAAEYLGPKDARQNDRATHLGFAAARDALDDAKLERAVPHRCGVVAGTGLGGMDSFLDETRVYLERGAKRVSPRAVPMVMPNATAAYLAIRLGWTGPNMCVSTACATGAHAIGEGTRLIREGSVDVVLAGGTEAAVSPVAIAAFARMSALSGRHDQPELASRPFDAERDGFVIAEGAAFLVLEEAGHAQARDARAYGEIAGYGRNCDAFHITAPSPTGSGAVACMRAALDDAGLTPQDIGHINAHGTSTPLNDAVEATAIGTVFGARLPPVTSVKGSIGHLIGAAGAVGALVSLLALRDGHVPPTANFEKSDSEVSLDVVALAPRPVAPQPVLCNAFGFGGHNASLVLCPMRVDS